MENAETAGNPATSSDDSGYPRLEDQIRWYDGKSVKAQRNFRILKIIQIVAAASIPVASLINSGSALVPGILGALILILEGLQELGMYRQNWHKYRSACEALRHEKYLFMARSGPYTGLEDQDAVRSLAERVEALVSEEHTNWIDQFKAPTGSKAK